MSGWGFTSETDESGRSVRRRGFLRAAGLTSMAALAGCNFLSTNYSSDEQTQLTPPGGPSTASPTVADVETTAVETDLECDGFEPHVVDHTVTKTRRTIYTDDRIDNARTNANELDWARSERDAVVSRADRFLSTYDLDDVWSLVTGQRVPRSATVDAERSTGSPTNGEEIYADGRYPWEVDPLGDPWKVTDPTSGMRYPTNDFASYLESGVDERGFFDPERADDQYLVNELYPDRGESWGVDDGYGWVADDGTRFTFVAYYNHHALWHSRTTQWALPAVAADLGKAYLFTDEQRYARAAAVILDRIADEYPYMNLEPYRESEGYLNSHGGTGRGKILGSEWEARLVKHLLDAYDAVFPAIEGDDELVSFLSGKAEAFDLGAKSTAADVRRNVENGIVRQVRPGVERAQIRGNFGMHQSALAKAAVVLDEPDGVTGELLEFTFGGDGLYTDECGYAVDGGTVLPRIVGVIDRDGHNNEGAPNYHQLALNRMRQVAQVLDGYDEYDGADLYGNVKIERMHDAHPPLLLCNRFQPNIGDSGRTGVPGVGWLDRETMLAAYERYRDPIYAQMVYLMNHGSVDGIHGGLFDEEPEKVADDIAAVVDVEGPLDLSSETLAGFGFTALRHGSAAVPDEPQRAVWLYYGRNDGHAHRDTLNLGLAAHDLNLAPDHGYPTKTGPWPERINWTQSTISHNTVTVDERRQESQWVAEPRHFDEDGPVSLVDVAAPEVYPQTDAYRRTTLLIEADREDSYAVDFFRVDGGDDHRFSFHAAEGPVAAPDLDLAEQGSGTYAGADVPKPEGGENTEYNISGDYTAWDGHRFNNGFNYLYDVARDDDPPEKFSADWDVVDSWDVREDDADVHLRLTMLGDVDDVAIATGDPPDRSGNPDSLRYLLAHRSGSDLRSRFTSVLEPYEESRFVASVDDVPVAGDGGTGRAVRVELESGRTDWVVSTTDSTGTYEVGDAFTFSGAVAVYSEEGGVAQYAYVQDGDHLTVEGERLVDPSVPRLEGTVDGFTRDLVDDNELVLSVDTDRNWDPEGLVDRWIYVDTDTDRNGAYEIHDADVDDGRLHLNLGSQTLVRDLSDVDDPDAGYEYNVAEGDAFTIPLSGSWAL